MKIKIFRSIRTKLTLLFVVIFGFIILASDIFLYKRFKDNILASIDNTLYTLAEEIEHTILKASPQVWRKEIKDVRDEFITSQFFIQVIEKSLHDVNSIKVLTKSEVISESSLQSESKQIYATISHQPVFLNITNKNLTSFPIRLILFPVIKKNNSAYIIQVGTSLIKTYQALDKLVVILMVSGPIVLVLSSLGAFVLLTRAINPVKNIVRTAKKITTKNLSQRIETKGRSDEIGQLILILNQMIERLEGSVNQMRQFTGDVSHELRNPLAVIVGEIEVTLRKVRKKEEYQRSMKIIHGESQKMTRMIDNLLLLSDIESSANQFGLEDIPLYEILLDVIKAYKTRFKHNKLNLNIKNVEAVNIKGNSILVSQMLVNLFDNAIKYTEEGGAIEISLQKKDKEAVFNIKDNGIGIQEESLPFIFDRFFQVDKSRSHTNTGHGLGLSIVNKIASLHQARIDVSSEPGKGTSLSVFFPLMKDKIKNF